MSIKKILNYSLPAMVITTFLVVVAVYAWTEPSYPPADPNAPAPINTTVAGQAKAGGLILNTGGANVGLIVDKGNVGIGTQNPQAKLDVAGLIQLTGFKMSTGAGAGKVLTSDVSGVGTWQTASGGGASGGIYGICMERDSMGHRCNVAPEGPTYPPATCGQRCECPAGYTRIILGTRSGNDTYFSCYKH